MGVVDQIGGLVVAAGYIYLQSSREGDGGHNVIVTDQFRPLPESLVDDLLHYRQEDLLLALETVVQAAVEYPGLMYYVPDCGVAVSFGIEQLYGRFEYLVDLFLATFVGGLFDAFYGFPRHIDCRHPFEFI